MSDFERKEYLVVLERGETNWSAYCPDVPGCIATGSTRAETVKSFREALEFHFAGLREDGEPIPVPISEAEMVSVSMAPVAVAAR